MIGDDRRISRKMSAMALIPYYDSEFERERRREERRSLLEKKIFSLDSTETGLAPITCCCCLCITLVLLTFLLLVATAVFYLWFDPKLPTFSLASFRLDGFKLTPDPDGASLSATAVARVEMRNPNTKLVFYYGNTAVEMSVGSGNDETGMGETTVSGFRQGPKNSTSVKVETSVKNQLLDMGLAKRLSAKFQSKDLVMNVVARTKVGLGVGGIKIGMLAVNLRCGGVSLNKLDTDSPKCILNTLKWVNLQ
ncbi:Late embryogenesis abundant (LEA) hydroxyproline-rich glycoprotein family [Raphanus sativus]|nr:Late embryogenesis abundant (LEA) hydroxyproline-rich glycoprotein family [Raphanus sativus]